MKQHIAEIFKRLNKLDKCVSCCNGGTSCCYSEITRAEAEELVENSGLITNTLYKITDRGIFLTAISTSQFEINGTRLMLIPNPEQHRPNNGTGVYNQSATYTEGDPYWGNPYINLNDRFPLPACADQKGILFLNDATLYCRFAYEYNPEDPNSGWVIDDYQRGGRNR